MIGCVKNKFLLAVAFFVGSLLFRSAVAAPVIENIEEALSPYPYAEVINSDTDQPDDYLLALGKVEKNRLTWVPEKQRRLAGELKTTTLAVDDGHLPQEVFDWYKQRIDALGAQVLFACQSRECGRSNAWANEIFHVKQLYGLDGEQQFSVFEIEDQKQHLHYVSLYTVARGNKRVYAHYEWLQTALTHTDRLAPDANVIIDQLKEKGVYVVTGLSLVDGKIVIAPEHLESLAKALTIGRFKLVRLVGHDYSGENLAAQMHVSLSYATELAAQLKGQGVNEKKLEPHGVGSLAPQRVQRSETAEPFRLELVLPSDSN